MTVATQRPARRHLMRTAELWLGTIIKRIFYVLSFDLLVRDLTGPLPTGRLHHRDLVLQRIATDELPWWEGLMGPKKLRQVRAALAEGDIASVALLEGRIVGQAWATRITKGDVQVRLAADEAYIYGLGTDERYRSMGTAVAVMSELLSALACDGVSRVYGYVDRRNRVSQVVHRTLLGFEQVQRARRVRLFRRWGFVVPGSAHPASGPLITSSRLRLPWEHRVELTAPP
jgi:ribosomal protein S18 acetylase RimI-like enzyme